MTYFFGEPVLEEQPDGIHHVVYKPYKIHDDQFGLITIPEGFVTDLGSIPKIFQNIISPEGKPERAYLLHDWLYSNSYHRKDSDEALFRAMTSLKVRIIEKWTIYLAVRWFGEGHWKRDREALMKGGLTMKKIAVAACLMLCALTVKAAPYLFVPFTKSQTYPNGAPLYLSQGMLYSSNFTETMIFTNAALAYHRASEGSLLGQWIPSLDPYLPNEAWSVNVGYGGASGNYLGGIGISVNLLDTTRSMISNSLKLVNTHFAQGLANAIAPTSTGPVSLTVGPEWTLPIIKDGSIPGWNQERLTTHWFIGIGYGF